MSQNFKVQKQLPEKHGSMSKKGKILGKIITRYFKIGWQDKHALLRYYNTADMEKSGKGKAISLEQYVCF